jgi:hypothetical protein
MTVKERTLARRFLYVKTLNQSYMLDHTLAATLE